MIQVALVSVTGPPRDVPVDPDAAQAQQWLINELAKPQYRAAQPTWFDRLSSAFWDWLKSLRLGDGIGAQGPILIVAAIVIVAALVTAFFIFGPPRFNRRSSVSAALFGGDDNRTAADLRRAAEDAAARGDWTVAIEEMFRSIARGLAERTILTVSPGTTARDFAVRAGAAMPPFADRLRAAAVVFDGVRYLDRVGTEEASRACALLERDLRAAKPVLADSAVSAG